MASVMSLTDSDSPARSMHYVQQGHKLCMILRHQKRCRLVLTASRMSGYIWAGIIQSSNKLAVAVPDSIATVGLTMSEEQLQCCWAVE